MPTEAWRDRAACRGQDKVFLAGRGGTDRSNPNLSKFDHTVVERSKAICHFCPVRLDCLDWALSERIQYYVYGGLSWPERKSILSRKSSPILVDSNEAVMLG